MCKISEISLGLFSSFGLYAALLTRLGAAGAVLEVPIDDALLKQEKLALAEKATYIITLLPVGISEFCGIEVISHYHQIRLVSGVDGGKW